MHITSSTYKNIIFLNHSGSSNQTMESFWDFINKWNFLNITNTSGIISLILLILIIGIYLVGLLRLIKKSNLKKTRIISITTALFLVFFVLEGPIDYFAEQIAPGNKGGIYTFIEGQALPIQGTNAAGDTIHPTIGTIAYNVGA